MYGSGVKSISSSNPTPAPGKVGVGGKTIPDTAENFLDPLFLIPSVCFLSLLSILKKIIYG
jgi:hypothetical protein